MQLAALLMAFGGCGDDDSAFELTYLDDVDPAAAQRSLRVLSILPATGPVTGGQLVMRSGTGFESDMTVTFGDAGALSVVVGGDELSGLRTPEVAAEGPVDVTVTLADGREFTVRNGYTYTPRPAAAPLDHPGPQP